MYLCMCFCYKKYEFALQKAKKKRAVVGGWGGEIGVWSGSFFSGADSVQLFVFYILCISKLGYSAFGKYTTKFKFKKKFQYNKKYYNKKFKFLYIVRVLITLGLIFKPKGTYITYIFIWKKKDFSF